MCLRVEYVIEHACLSLGYYSHHVEVCVSRVMKQNVCWDNVGGMSPSWHFGGGPCLHSKVGYCVRLLTGRSVVRVHLGAFSFISCVRLSRLTPGPGLSLFCFCFCFCFCLCFCFFITASSHAYQGLGEALHRSFHKQTQRRGEERRGEKKGQLQVAAHMHEDVDLYLARCGFKLI